MDTLETLQPEARANARDCCPRHGNKCPTRHLTAFQRASGKWRGTLRRYGLDGQPQGTVEVEAENRLDCDSFYTLLILTLPEGLRIRLEFDSLYSRKRDAFVVENPAIQGTARQVGDSIVYMYEDRNLPGPNMNLEVVTVQGDTRLHMTQQSIGGAFTGYSILQETRVEPAAH